MQTYVSPLFLPWLVPNLFLAEFIEEALVYYLLSLAYCLLTLLPLKSEVGVTQWLRRADTAVEGRVVLSSSVAFLMRMGDKKSLCWMDWVFVLALSLNTFIGSS